MCQLASRWAKVAAGVGSDKSSACALTAWIEVIEIIQCPAGGLGDVMGALPKALARRGHRVMVVVPRYSNYEEGWDTSVRRSFRVMGSDTEARILLSDCVTS